MTAIKLFTDGSCNSATGTGGWGALIVTRSESKLLYGCLHPTTISRCELIPVIEGLAYIRRHMPAVRAVKLYSDSELTVKSIGGLYDPRKNLDLWRGYEEVSEGVQILAEWHNRNILTGMSAADGAAYAAYTHMKELVTAFAGAELPAWEDVDEDT